MPKQQDIHLAHTDEVLKEAEVLRVDGLAMVGLPGENVLKPAVQLR